MTEMTWFLAVWIDRSARRERWFWGGWATTKIYSKPLHDLTGKRPVRSADDHCDLVMVLARDRSVKGGSTGARGGGGQRCGGGIVDEGETSWGGYLSGGGDAFSEGVQLIEGCREE
jgi:hypothetical protein